MARQVYVVEKLGHTIRTPTKIKRVRHDAATAASHRERRNRQAAMEQLLNSAGKRNAFASIAVKRLEPAENEIVFRFIARTLEDKKKVCQHPHEDQTRRCWRKITGLRP